MVTKQRTASVKVGQQGMLAIREFCQQHSLIFQAEPSEDYGVDCWIEVERDGHATNFLVGVQSKSGSSYKINECDSGFALRAKAADLGYWMAANIPMILCYHDPDNDVLYWKHIQAHVAEAGGSAATVLFDKRDDLADARFANYLRELVARTPSAASRLEVFVNEPVLVVNGQSSDCSAHEPGAPLRLMALFEPAPGSDMGWRYPRETVVLGYDEEGSRVGSLEVEHVGQMCDELFVQVYDRVHLTVERHPIYERSDYENEDARKLAPSELERRLGRAEEVLNENGVLTPAFSHPMDSGLVGALNLSLRFGRQSFDVEVRHLQDRDALVATNRLYRPERAAELVLERLTPGVPPFELPRRVQCIVSVCVSRNGRLVSLGGLRNEEHGCWGTTDVQWFHVPLEELRQSLARSLLT